MPTTVPWRVAGLTARMWIESARDRLTSWPGRASEPITSTNWRSEGTGISLRNGMGSP